eukprot:gene7578-2978_t
MQMQAEGIDVFAVYVCNPAKGKKGTCGEGKYFMDQMASKPPSKYSLTVTDWNDVEALIASI